MQIGIDELNGVQAIREQWNQVSEEDHAVMQANLGEGVTEYQFWVELLLMFSRKDALKALGPVTFDENKEANKLGWTGAKHYADRIMEIRLRAIEPAESVRPEC